jgi:hypothetical protein
MTAARKRLSGRERIRFGALKNSTIGAQEADGGRDRFEFDHIAFGLEARRVVIAHAPGERASVGQLIKLPYQLLG